MRGDGYYCLFCDAGFANDKYLQVMTRAYVADIADNAKSFKPSCQGFVFTSRFENAFAGKSKVFNFLSF